VRAAAAGAEAGSASVTTAIGAVLGGWLVGHG